MSQVRQALLDRKDYLATEGHQDHKGRRGIQDRLVRGGPKGLGGLLDVGAHLESLDRKVHPEIQVLQDLRGVRETLDRLVTLVRLAQQEREGRTVLMAK